MIHFVSKLPERLVAGNIYFVKGGEEATGSLTVGDRNGNPIDISSKDLIRACISAQLGQPSGLASLGEDGKLHGDQLPRDAVNQSQVEQIIAGKLESFAAGAPKAMDTLKELSDALNGDPDFAANVTAELGKKASADAVYSKQEVDTELDAVHQGLGMKQDALPNANAIAKLGEGTFGGETLLTVKTIEW